MSPFSSFLPNAYISELENTVQHAEGAETLQQVDALTLNLVRKALQIEDLFVVVLVRNYPILWFHSREELTGCRDI